MGRKERRQSVLARRLPAIVLVVMWVCCAPWAAAAEPPNELQWPAGSVGAEPVPAEIAMPAESVVAKSPLFCHPHPDDPLRHRNKGGPLMGTSWRNRPLYMGCFVGGLFGDSLESGKLEQGDGLFGGYQLGCDFDHYWGAETRIGFANLDVIDQLGSEDLGTSGAWLGDASLLYYPWGDTRWRPYATFGLGLAGYKYRNNQHQRRTATVVGMPFGLGMKYYHQSWLALRMSAMDNLTFGNSGVRTMNNFSLTLGFEVHWGGRAMSYYPWNSSAFFW